MISLPRRSLRRFAATSRAPGCGLRETSRSSKGFGDPRKASKDIDAAICASLTRRSPSWTRRAPSPAGIAHRERVRAEEEGRADLVLAEGRSLADRVAPEEVDLQRADVGVGDRDVREFPEPGLDAVGEGALRDDLLQGAAARVDALRRGGGEPHRFASAGDRHDVGEVEGPAVDRTHGGPPRHPAASINVFSRTPKTLSARGPSGTV